MTLYKLINKFNFNYFELISNINYCNIFMSHLVERFPFTRHPHLVLFKNKKMSSRAALNGIINCQLPTDLEIKFIYLINRLEKMKAFY